MQRIVLFIIGLLLFVSCCESTENSSINYNITYTTTYKRINVKDEYKIIGYSDHMRIYVFEIDNHEYIGDPYSGYFIHSPNCNCHKEKESCTSSDFLSQPSWY